GSEETRESLAKGQGITFPTGEEVIKWLTDGGRMTEIDIREKIAKICNSSTYVKNGVTIAWEDCNEYEKGLAYDKADQILSIQVSGMAIKDLLKLLEEGKLYEEDDDQSFICWHLQATAARYSQETFCSIIRHEGFRRTKKVGFVAL
ncbi:hypothetical protein LCGC14_1716080, partial [marine sediment metagenome]